MAMIADGLGAQFVSSQITGKPVPASFVASSAKNAQAFINAKIKSSVAAQVTDSIRDTTAAGVLKSYDNSGYLSTNFSGAYPKEVTIVKFYTKDQNGDYVLKKPADQLAPIEAAELRAGQERLYRFAVAHHQSLDTNQAQEAGNAVGDAVAKAVRENPSMNRIQIAAMIETETRASLHANRGAIDGQNPDNKVAEINKNSGGDLFDKIAKGLSTQVQDDAQAYEQIQKAQAAVASVKQVQMRQAVTSTAGGIRHDAGFNQPDGSLVGAAGTTRAMPRSQDNAIT
jgi:hypothetical protein